MHRDHSQVAHLTGGAQGGFQLGGMMGVIVHDQRAVALADGLEPAAGPLEVLGGVGTLLCGQTKRHTHGAHGQSVVDVVVAGHRQADAARRAGQHFQIKLVVAGAVLLHIGGLEVTFLCLDAKGAHVAVGAAQHIHRVRVVHIGKHAELGHQGKPLKGKLQLAHAAVVVQMIVVHVQDHAVVGGQLQEGLGVLAGFDHDLVAFAGFAVAADQRQLAADHRAGITTGQLQRGGDHGGGGGLAVGACHADAVLVQAAYIAQQHAALDGADTVRLGVVQLRVGADDGGGVHHQIGAGRVFGRMANGDSDAHGALAFNDRALGLIAAADLVAAGGQDLDQGIHTAAAAADEVDFFDSVQQVASII